MADDFDPAGTLSADDPLRAWQAQIQDPALGMLMVTDPEKAIEVMKQRGIAPPPTASAYTDPASGLNIPSDTDTTYNAPVRTNPDGTISGNLTSPTNPDSAPPQPQGGTPSGDRRPIFQRIHDYFNPVPSAAASPGAAPASVTPPSLAATKVAETGGQKANSSGPFVAAKSSAGEDLDPEEDKPTTGKQPEAGGKTESSGSNSKTANALSGFSDSFKGIKAPTPPPLNAVGTPGTPHPNAINAPGIQQLLALAGQAAPGSALGTLGRLLVQGKA